MCSSFSLALCPVVIIVGYLNTICIFVGVCCGTTSLSVITLRNRIIHVGNRGISIRYSAHLYTVSSTLLRACYQLFSVSRLSDAAYCAIGYL